MIKILHSADWHLDSAMQLGGESLRKALLEIPGKIAAICKQQQCDLVLLSGDLFDGAYTQDSLRILKNALEEMAVPVFITPGNHDFASVSSPWLREVFPESKPVQASILCYPVITADPGIAHLGSFRNLLGVQKLTLEEKEKFSCDRLVNEKTPPAFLWHTAEDNSVPVANTLRYAEALSKFQIPFAVHIYPAGWHGLATVDEQTNNNLPPQILPAQQWLPDLKAWLKHTL